MALLFSLLFLSACTDYVAEIDEQIEEMQAGTDVSSSSLPSSSSAKVDAGSEYDATAKTLKDLRDGQTYKTVTIGDQVWMAENLNYETENSYCYDDDPSNCAKYGRLYTWAAAMDSVGTWTTNGKGCGYNKTCSPTYPVRGVCPSGWHLPSEAEFETLFTAVGGKSTAGTKLKSQTGWAGLEGITNEDAFGFSALPAGDRHYGGLYDNGGNYAYFWSSTEYDSYNAYVMLLYYGGDDADLGNNTKGNGLSVRCLKDEVSGQAEQSSSSVTPKSSSSLSSSSSAKSSSSVTPKSSSATGEVSPCSALPGGVCDYGTLTDTRDGQTYKTVTIGTQTWMAENLNYETGNSYCYDGADSNCTKYGRLYTWAAAKTVCPSGWHLPSKTEFETLFTAVGGKSTAGTALKSTSGWNENEGESGNGTDAFGFSALPAGYRNYNGSYYYECSYGALFWSSTEYGSSGAYYMYLDYGSDNAGLISYSKSYGHSVRCLKDEVSGQAEQSSSSVTPKSSSSLSSSSSAKVDAGSEYDATAKTLTDSRDGQTYKTVTIGTQTWMAENLNFKTDSSFCYSNDEANCVTYGRLYTWSVAMSACPNGWHLPSYDEWNSLFTAVGGASTAGPVLRATSGWYGNGNGSDDFGFSALPAGNYDQGYFNNREDEASFWMADEFNSESASYARLRYWEAYVYLGDHYKHYGLSVRCLKD